MNDDFPVPLGRDDQPTDRSPRDERLEKLPGHEIDDEQTVGGGITGAGGTAIDRGTGTLGGRAQQPEADEADDDGMLPSVVEFDDHERSDADDRATPGIDDPTD